ncbi:MAG: hypothetical protein ABF504_15220, partial [Komagataeibacter saccharivorans]|uniref:hypothetical protein n=1 Tax=Komagataeibacter saccharivorans TaxID=265959 RepID=UPI0039EB9671
LPTHSSPLHRWGSDDLLRVTDTVLDEEKGDIDDAFLRCDDRFRYGSAEGRCRTPCGATGRNIAVAANVALRAPAVLDERPKWPRFLQGGVSPFLPI